MVLPDLNGENIYRPSEYSNVGYDGGLGEDIIAIINKRNQIDEEYQEVYVNNRMKNCQKKKKIDVSSDDILMKPLFPKKLLATFVLASCGVVAFQNYQVDSYIANQVVESGIIPEDLSIRNDSQSGYLFSYLDEYGVRQNMGGDYFVQTVVAKGETLGFNADQVAIALDFEGIYKASYVEGSSLLGRIGQEMIASSQLLSNNPDQSNGRGK